MIVNELVTTVSIAGLDRMVRKHQAAMDKMKLSAATAAQRTEAITQHMNNKAAIAAEKMAAKQAKAFEKTAVAAERAARRAAAAYNKAQHGLKTAKGNLGMGGIGSALLMGGGALAAGMGYEIFRGGKEVLKYGEEYEGMMAGLTTSLGGSAKKAQEAFARIEKFAVRTPYEMRDGMQAFMKLTNLGMSTTDEAMTAYGDMASSMKLPYDKMIMAVERAAIGLDFRRSALFGITARKQGDGIGDDEIGLSFRGHETIVKRNTKAIEEYYQTIAKSYFKNGMQRQMTTIGGIMSNVSDSFAQLGRHIWKSGVDVEAKKFGNWLINTIQSLTKWSDTNMPKVIATTKQWLGYIPVVAAGLLGIGSAIAYIKIVSFVGKISKLVAAYQALALAGNTTAVSLFLADAAAMAIPVAIGVAVAAVSWFGYQVYRYMTGGEKAIAGLRKQFPWLADSIRWVGQTVKWLWPMLKTTGVFIWRFLVLTFKLLWPLVMWIWKEVVAPFFTDFADLIITVGKWLATAYDFWMPKLVAGFYTWKSVLEDVWAFLEPKFKWLLDTLGQVGNIAGNAFNSVAGLFGGGNSADQSSGGNLGIAGQALRFIQSGQADKIARLDATGYWKTGVACAWMSKQMTIAAGAKKELTDAMTASAPQTYSNLVNKNLADKVSLGQTQPGDYAFYVGKNGIQHMAIVGPNGTLFEASNSHGKEIGRGQRYVQQKNWMGNNGLYLRAKPGLIPQTSPNAAAAQSTPSVTVNMPLQVNGHPNPAQVKQTASGGVDQALTRAGFNQARPASPTR